MVVATVEDYDNHDRGCDGDQWGGIRGVGLVVAVVQYVPFKTR